MARVPRAPISPFPGASPRARGAVRAARLPAPGQSGLEALGAGLGQAAQSISSIDRRQLRHETLEVSAGWATAQGEISLQFAQRTDDAADEEFIPHWMDMYDQARDAAFEGKDPRILRELEPKLAESRAEWQQKLAVTQAKARLRQDALSLIRVVSTLNAPVYAGDLSPNAAIEQYGAALDAFQMTATQKQEYLLEGGQELYDSHVRGRIERDPQAALDALKKGQYSEWIVDESRRNRLIAHGESVLRGRLSELQRVWAGAASAVDGVQDKGYPVPEAMLADLRSKAVLPEHIEALEALARRNNQLGAWVRMLPAQLQEVQAELAARRPTGMTPGDVQLLDDVEKVLDEMDAGLKKNPLDWGVEAGVTPSVPLDTSSTSAFAESLGMRTKIAQDMSDKYGVPVPPLHDREIAVVRAHWESSGVQARLAMAKVLIAADLAGMPGVRDELFKRLGEERPDMEAVLALIDRGDDMAAHAVLAGLAWSEENPNTWARAATGFSQAASDVVYPVRLTDRGRMEAAVRSALRGAYVYLAKLEDGKSDALLEFDDNIFDSAVQMVVGEVDEVFDADTFIPPGWDDDQVEEWVRRQDLSAVVMVNHGTGENAPFSWDLNDIRLAPVSLQGDYRIVGALPGGEWGESVTIEGVPFHLSLPSGGPAPEARSEPVAEDGLDALLDEILDPVPDSSPSADDLLNRGLNIDILNRGPEMDLSR